MELNTKKSIGVASDIIRYLNKNNLNMDTTLNEFIHLVYLLGYHNGAASSISGGIKKWKDVFSPLIREGDYDECLVCLNNILGEINEKKKINPYLAL